MAKNGKVSNEQIVAALLTSGTIRATAKTLNISERTIYDRMTEGEFVELYKGAKTDLMRQAVFSLNEQIQSAICTVAEIMNNEDNNAAIRLQAAQTLLNTASKFTQRLESEEQAIKRQTELNSYYYEL